MLITLAKRQKNIKVCRAKIAIVNPCRPASVIYDIICINERENMYLRGKICIEKENIKKLLRCFREKSVFNQFLMGNNLYFAKFGRETFCIYTDKISRIGRSGHDVINLVLTPCLLQVILGGGVPDAGHLNRTVLLRWTTRFVCTDSLSMVGRTAVDKRTDREIGKIKTDKRYNQVCLQE